MKTAHQGEPVAALPSGVWRPVAAAPEPEQVVDSVLGLFGAGKRQEPQPRPREVAVAPPPPPRNAPPTVHGLENLLPPENIPGPGAKRADRRPPPDAPVGEEKNLLEKLFGG